MKIDKRELNRWFWFEDENGKIIEEEDIRDDAQYVTYHSLNPLRLSEEISTFNYDKEKGCRGFEHLVNFNTGFAAMQDVIIAMVNKGDYTLGEAIVLCATCCERCMNVLAYKYLDGKDGYEEYSEEWYKANTVCKFCKEDNIKNEHALCYDTKNSLMSDNVDSIPGMQAKWKLLENDYAYDDMFTYECSNCLSELCMSSDAFASYCPNCGAKMDKR